MPRAAAWPLLCALLVAASVLLWMAGVAGHVNPARWMWQPDSWRQQPWTLWTASVLHFRWPLLLGNALAMAALAVAGASLHTTPRDALALLLAWPLSTLGLLMWPQVGGYNGLSAVVHAATAIVALRAMAQPPVRWLGLLLAGGLMIKLALERGWVVPIGFDTGWGFNAVFAAHLTGAAAGAALAVLLQLGSDE